MVKPTRAIFLGDFAPLRETPRATLTSPFVPSVCFVVPLPALARTEYRSAEYKYEYEFANRKNGREMRKAMGRNFPLISWAAGPAASAVIMVR